MSYTHKGTAPIELSKDPIDVDSTDWLFFSYENWLRTDESIISNSAIVDGATLVTDSTLLGTVQDADGTEYTNTYGVEIAPLEDSRTVTVTHRVSTETLGLVDIGRTDVDRTVTINVEAL